MPDCRVNGKQEIRVPVWWRKMTRREREVMQRILERHARELAAKWDAEDRERGAVRDA